MFVVELRSWSILPYNIFHGVSNNEVIVKKINENCDSILPFISWIKYSNNGFTFSFIGHDSSEKQYFFTAA